MLKNKFNPTKEKLAICYSHYREMRHWSAILDDEDNQFYNRDIGLILSRVKALKYHIERYFPESIVSACESMYADYRNDFDKYRGASWCHGQAKKTWGNDINSWKRGKRIADLITFGSLSDIPF